MNSSQTDDFGKHFSLPVVGAVAVHAVVAALLFGSWSLTSHKTLEFKIPDHIRAEIVTIEQPKPEPAPVTKPEPKPQPKPQPKAEPKPQPKAEPKPEPKPQPVTETKPEPVQPKPEPVVQPEEAVVNLNEEVVEAAADEPTPEVESDPVSDLPSDEELFESLLAGLAQEDEEISQKIADIEQQQARDAEIAAQVSDYKAVITEQIIQKWSRPVELQLIDVSGFEAKVLVELLPTGELLDVSITESSGHANYDQSVVRAIEKVRRFNVPEDAEVFEAGGFRRLIVTFRPEDLMSL